MCKGVFTDLHPNMRALHARSTARRASESEPTWPRHLFIPIQRKVVWEPGLQVCAAARPAARPSAASAALRRGRAADLAPQRLGAEVARPQLGHGVRRAAALRRAQRLQPRQHGRRVHLLAAPR